jgi:hypothetical protein
MITGQSRTNRVDHHYRSASFSERTVPRHSSNACPASWHRQCPWTCNAYPSIDSMLCDACAWAMYRLPGRAAGVLGGRLRCLSHLHVQVRLLVPAIINATGLCNGMLHCGSQLTRIT